MPLGYAAQNHGFPSGLEDEGILFGCSVHQMDGLAFTAQEATMVGDSGVQGMRQCRMSSHLICHHNCFFFFASPLISALPICSTGHVVGCAT